jgi:phosphoribosylformylglycinamidine synthase
MLRLYKPIKDKEICYYIEAEDLSPRDVMILGWLLDFPAKMSVLGEQKVFEVGPRLSWVSPWSSTVHSILRNCGVLSITRIEKSTRSLVPFEYDKMTEEIYDTPLERFGGTVETKDPSCREMNVVEANREYKLGLDKEDICSLQYLFQDRLPRLIELYDLTQSNSEHCRHHFFRGELVIDGVEMRHSLFDLVKRPYKVYKDGGTVVAFCDNSSAIDSNAVNRITASKPLKVESQHFHPTFTAETHNFPTGICPRAGAMTGVGGRQRDNQSIGCGGELLAGTAGYCVGNLDEDGKGGMASPLKILIEASNGVSDYGNKVGEPLIQGFLRMFRQGQRGWVKPILFSGGVGQVRAEQVMKKERYRGLMIAKLGGPAYRIGMGGGAASSRAEVREDDFNAVQRGDPLMNQKVGRVIRYCTQFTDNPIISISDQGAGGNANVLKELVSPLGAEIDLDLLITGDETMTPLELWIAEYQESHAVLTNNPVFLESVCKDEGVPFCVIGKITDTGRMVVKYHGDVVVDLDLEKTVENVPKKTFRMVRRKKDLSPFDHPRQIPLYVRRQQTWCMELDDDEKHFVDLPVRDPIIMDLWKKVVKLPSVASKRFLTVKVDRSVGGLVVQQQCVGPLHTPLANVAVTAQEFYRGVCGVGSGIATSIGEKPLLSLIDPRRMARMAVAEALTNMVWADVDLDEINCSGNWMWPEKNADLVDAAEALSDILIDLDVVLDGGKDSLSMKAGDVEAPGSLVVSCYTSVHNFNVINPVMTLEANHIYLLTLGSHKARMGGSALAQVCGQIGDDCPDVDSPRALKALFNYVQFIRDEIVCGHDRSDGGLLTCLIEMCLAGNCGMNVWIDDDYLVHDPVSYLFNEEVGVVIGTREELDLGGVPFDVSVQRLGQPNHIDDKKFILSNSFDCLIEEKITDLRDLWEETSFELDMYQSNPVTVQQEKEGMKNRKNPKYNVTFPMERKKWKSKPRVVVLRAEGTNGHREMAAAFYYTRFEVWDVHTTELKKDPTLLRNCHGLVFPGGFSFSDALGAGRGAAGLLRFNSEIQEELGRFYSRGDTFSIGVCNGFQIMVNMNTFGPDMLLTHNVSGRFESRCVSVRIMDDDNIFFKDMKDSVLPVWSAHAEGKFETKSVVRVAVEYANDDGEPTDVYPFSPNGGQTAGIVSLNGRHLGMMPHPERCFLPWQLPWNPEGWKTSPWSKMFQNIREWCD